MRIINNAIILKYLKLFAKNIIKKIVNNKDNIIINNKRIQPHLMKYLKGYKHKLKYLFKTVSIYNVNKF